MLCDYIPKRHGCKLHECDNICLCLISLSLNNSKQVLKSSSSCGKFKLKTFQNVCKLIILDMEIGKGLRITFCENIGRERIMNNFIKDKGEDIG